MKIKFPQLTLSRTKKNYFNIGFILFIGKNCMHRMSFFVFFFFIATSICFQIHIKVRRKTKKKNVIMKKR